jgi:hypothetical protein
MIILFSLGQMDDVRVYSVRGCNLCTFITRHVYLLDRGWSTYSAGMAMLILVSLGQMDDVRVDVCVNARVRSVCMLTRDGRTLGQRHITVLTHTDVRRRTETTAEGFLSCGESRIELLCDELQLRVRDLA